MDAKELRPMAEALDDWARSKDSAGNNSTAESLKAAAFAIRSYASLLASVEGSGEEIVRRLIRCAELSGDDGIELTTGDKFRCNYREEFHHAAARIVSDEQEKERLRAELASVKAHAEAMANDLEPFTRTVMGMPAGKAKSLEAYRAAHPKDAP